MKFLFVELTVSDFKCSKTEKNIYKKFYLKGTNYLRRKFLQKVFLRVWKLDSTEILEISHRQIFIPQIFRISYFTSTKVSSANFLIYIHKIFSSKLKRCFIKPVLRTSISCRTLIGNYHYFKELKILIKLNPSSPKDADANWRRVKLPLWAVINLTFLSIDGTKV